VDTPRFKNYLGTPDVLGLIGNPAQLAYVNLLANSGDQTQQAIAGLFRQALVPMNFSNVSQLLTTNNGVFRDVTRAQDWVARVDYQPTQNPTLTFRLPMQHVCLSRYNTYVFPDTTRMSSVQQHAPWTEGISQS
jgi:hypothetical protein